MVHMNDDPRGTHAGVHSLTGRLAAVAATAALLGATPVLRSRIDPRRYRSSRAEVRELAPSVQATGIVRSRAAADLAAAVNGRLQFVAEPGTAVTAGQVVARLDTREMSLARAEQAARVKRAQRQPDRARSRTRSAAGVGKCGVTLQRRPGAVEP